ncbi:MAG TPA: glycosyltransferase family 1 protein [Flavobacterium sp.]|nr:glycosyltransferase family 1 protein [Flavobacterium sp.]
MKNIFLESHNVDNLCFGFGQFNYHLIMALSEIETPEYKITLHAQNILPLKKEFGNKFNYKRYFSLRRYPLFRICKKYDLWHSMNQNTKVEPHGDLPYLLTVHNISHIQNPESYKHLDNHVKFQAKLSRSSAIVYISQYAKESTHRFFEVPNVPEFVIYNGNTISEINLPENHLPKMLPDGPFLFTIGQISERKNFIALVDFMAQLPDYKLVIAGKDSTKAATEIRQRLADLKLQGRIFLIGEINDFDKQYYYQQCEAFVFPSLREGFGLPIIEAMRFGKPVFISNNTSLPEIGGGLAHYWDHYDPAYMRDVFEKGMHVFQQNPQQNSEMLIERSKVFSWQKAAREYSEVYRMLLK